MQVIFRNIYVCTHTPMHATPFEDKRGHDFEKKTIRVYEKVAGRKVEYEIM